MLKLSLKSFFLTSTFLLSVVCMPSFVMAQDIGPVAGTVGTDGTTGTAPTGGTSGGIGALFTAAGQTRTAVGNISGGSGGNGGADTNGGGNGGAGGDGNIGVSDQGNANSTLIINNSFTVSGGGGGLGGNVNAGVGNGGAGGAGGVGVLLTGANAVVTLNATSTIQGGNGFHGGTGFGGGTQGAGGSGGVGIVVQNSATINLNGSSIIQGGSVGSGTGAPTVGVGIRMDGTGGTLTLTGENGIVRAGRTSENGTALLVNTTGSTVNNGTSLRANSNGNAVVRYDTNTTNTLFNNTGSVLGNSSEGIYVTSNDTLTEIRNTGSGIISSGINAILIEGNAPLIVNSAAGSGGLVGTGNTSAAIFVGTGGNIDTVDNTNGRMVSDNNSPGGGTVIIAHDVNGANFIGGTMQNFQASGNVFVIAADQTGAISSSSTITAGSGAGNAVRFSDATATFTNTGTLNGHVTSSTSTKSQIFNNAGGAANGNITLDDGADQFNMSGGTLSSTSTVNMGAGNDAITYTGGTMAASSTILMDAGDDTFTYNNQASAIGLGSSINFGIGTNTLSVLQDMTTQAAITTNSGHITNATVAAGRTLTVSGANLDLANGTMTTNGITQINAGRSLLADVDALGTSGQYIFQVLTATSTNGTSASNGLLDLTGGTAQSAISSLAHVGVNVASNVNIRDGAQIRIVRAASNETTDFTGGSVSDNSYLYNFLLRNGNDTGVTFTGANANDLIIEVDRVGGAAISDMNASKLDPVLESLLTLSSDATIGTIQSNLANAPSADAYQTVAESLMPTMTGGIEAATQSLGGGFMDVSSARMSDVRGMSSGDVLRDRNVWVRAYGQTAQQDKRGFIDGYEADTTGLVVGADTEITDAAVLGAAFGYGRADIDAKNANRTNTDVDSYQFMLYGDYDLPQGVIIEGMATYAYNQINSVRRDVGGVIGNDAKADYNGHSSGVRLEMSRTYRAASGVSLTPDMSLEYMRFSPDSYTETGAGASGLTVKTDDSHIVTVGTGVTAQARYVQDNGAILVPHVHLGFKRDILNDAITTTSNFGAGGAAFTTQGADPEKNRFMLGAGVDLETKQGITLRIQYDYEGRSDYDSHTGTLNGSLKF